MVNSSRPLPYSLLGLLLLSCTTGCSDPTASLGNYPGDSDSGSGSDTDGTSTSGSSGDSSETTDTEGACDGPECDPGFGVAFVRGRGAEGVEVTRVGGLLCDDDSCLGPDDDATPCAETPEAMESSLGPEEYCRLSAGWLTAAFEIGFTTPIERESFELLRDDPSGLGVEPYFWRTEVVELRGPGTTYRGDALLGASIDGISALDRFGSVVNETCAQRLTQQGVEWTEDTLETSCVGTSSDGDAILPLRMQPDMVFEPVAGELTTIAGGSQSSSGQGPDTVCSACDYATGPLVARYGVDASGTRRTVAESTAIACDPGADVLLECVGLNLAVEREDGLSFEYAWDAGAQGWPLPLPDKLRETHPDVRPDGLEPPGPACDDHGDCLEGQRCYGQLQSGEACSDGDACTDRTCRFEWFGGCEVTAGSDAYCVDRRFSPRAAACWAHVDDPNTRLSSCDTNADGQLDEAGCCDADLGGETGCDPHEQDGLVRRPRYDRDPGLQPEAACTCEDDAPSACEDVVIAWCEPPTGEGKAPNGGSPTGRYAVPLLRTGGGVRWDSEAQTLDLRLANLGDRGRALTEGCAEDDGIANRSTADGWLANSRGNAELRENHDVGLCSGSTYTLVFADSSREHRVRSQLGGTLDGRASYTIQTPQFRPLPSGLRSADEGEMRSCGRFEVDFTNEVDIGPLNLAKLSLHQGASSGPRVAGGPGCGDGPDAEVPCLRVGFDGSRSTVVFEIDESVHGQVLQTGETYTLVIPGLPSIEDMSDPSAHAAAFHDVCGMPLVDTEAAMSIQIDAACEG